MKKAITRILSVVLALATVLSLFPATALAEGEERSAELRPFADAGVSAETRSKELFYFGSANLTVSEKSTDDYLLKICRGGKAEGTASVTVKFADYSAVYGENYTVSLYNGDGVMTENPYRFSVLQFLTENADSYTEVSKEVAEEEERNLLSQFASQKNADLYDVNGKLISSLQMKENDDDGGEASYSLESEDMANSNDFDSNLSDYSTAVQVRLTFTPGETEKFIIITPKYSREAQGDAQAEITLDNPSEGMFIPDEDFITVLTVRDEDNVAPAVLNITESEISADGDSVTLTVTRKGAINKMVGARVTTKELSAVTGDDFQGVDAMLYFPMGVTKRDITLKLNHRFTDKSVQFRLGLSEPVSAVFDNESCLVTVLPAEDSVVSLQSEYSLMGDSIDGLSSTPYDFTVHGYSVGNKAWLTGSTSFYADNRGDDCPYNTWCGVYFNIPKYCYAGMSVNWSVGRTTPTYGCSEIGYYNASSNYKTIFSKDTGAFSKDWDSGMFSYLDTVRGYVGIRTSSFHGKYMTVHQILMARMKYSVNLVAADSLPYVGVSSAEEKTYVAASISGCALETTKKDVYFGDSITFTTPNTGKSFAVLTGLLIVDSKGNKLYDVKNIDSDAIVLQNGTSATLTLTEKLITSIGKTLSDKGYYTQNSGRWEGKLYVKPVFDYQKADVFLSSLDEGEASFEGYKNVTQTMHLGDVISFTEDGTASSKTADAFTLATTVDNPTYHSVGFDADIFSSADVSAAASKRTGSQYANKTCSVQLTSPRTVIYPRVSSVDNRVVVRVDKELVNGGAFDTEQGIFTYSRTESGSYYSYTLTDVSKKLSADELVSVYAVPKNSGTAAIWKRGTDQTVYSGNVMYMFTGNKAQDNLLTLSLSDSAGSYTVKGTAYCDNSVIGSANKTSVSIPAIGAALAAGSSTAVTDSETGEFELTGVTAVPNTTVPVLVYFNNSANVLPVSIPVRGTTVNMPSVNLSTNNGDTAYVKNVYFSLGGVSLSSTHGITMNGKKLIMSAEVADGNKYTVTVDGSAVEKTEKVTSVSFLILDGRTYEIKSVHEAKKSSDGVWDAQIMKFTPETPDEFDSGDLFYVQIATDRVSASLKEGGDSTETFYAPIATAYGVAAGGEYTPQTISYTEPNSADALMGDGAQGTKSFAKLPIIGNMDLLSFFSGRINIGSIGSDYSYGEDEDGDPTSVGSSQPSSPFFSKASVRITVRTQTLPDGRLRLHIGAVITVGNQKCNQLSNPYETAVSAYDMCAGARKQSAGYSSVKGLGGMVNLINTSGENKENAMKSNLSGLQLSFSVSFGIYLDFVIIADDGKLDDFYFVGVGGYLGFSGNLTYVAYFVIPVVFLPAYLGFSVSAGVMGYMGGTKDLSQYLQDSFTSDEFLEQENIVIDDTMVSNHDGMVSLSVTGFAGIGVCNVLGIRLNLTLGFDLTYVQRMTEWYPNLTENWGTSVNLTVGGQVDLLFTSVPFNGLSVPLASAGFDRYFMMLYRGDKMLRIIYKHLVGSDAELTRLQETVEHDVSTRSAVLSKLEDDVYALYDYMYNHSSLFDISKDAIYMMYHTDSDVYYFLADEGGAPEYNIKQPVKSEWLGDEMQLQSGYEYSETQTSKLVSNGYDNPGTQLVSLGNGKTAMFFLADPSAIGNPQWCGTYQTSVLVYSVFDGTSWSAPAAVAESATNDYYPNVVKCGDNRLMVSWVSVPEADKVDEEDYTKEEVIEIYSSMEIFTTMYDIAGNSFSPVTQLTDDDFMDICPQGVYDSTTGDCAVYYIKTAADDEIPPSEMSLTEFFNLYSDTTYSMVCYRLYDGAAGKWVVDYYPSEMAHGYTQADYASAKGQRYLPSVLDVLKREGVVDADAGAALYTFEVYDNGDTVTKSSYIDPPINDIAVCEGYNGLAVYAYTVDMDRNLSTNSDTELFIQVYDFASHKTYRPIRLTDDEYSQARPKLVRSEGSTYLFWLGNDSVIQYTDVSELIRDYVDADGKIVSEYYVDNTGKIYYTDKNGIYSLSGSERVYVPAGTDVCRICDDGTYCMNGDKSLPVGEEELHTTSALIENVYEFVPSVVSSTSPVGNLNPTVSDYQAIIDNDGNIYILWTQLVPDADETNPFAVPANEVFASAMIREASGVAAGWSTPYQLTKFGRQLDGVSGAVSSDGKLVLAYNSYEMKYIGDSDEFLRNAHLNADGTLSGNPYSISATDLMVTRLNETGCMKASSVVISDMTPVAGETVSVSAVIENAGLTTAKQGFTASFYELRGNERGASPVAQFTDTDAIAANGSRTVTFDWTVPADFEGIKLLAVVKETGHSNENTFESDAVRFSSEYELTVIDVSQKDDKFAASYTVTNTGNAATKPGDRIELRFHGLYQSFEKYGLDTDLLKTLALETLLPGESRTFITEFSVPMAAFDLIGYDQLDIYIMNAEDEIYASDSGDLVLREPVNMTLNGNSDVSIVVGGVKLLDTSLGNRWLSRLNTVSYTVADESVAMVTDSGRLTAVGTGETTVTATALPSGKQTTVAVKVYGGSVGGGTSPAPVKKSDASFTDVKPGAYYCEAVEWAVEKEITTGITDELFAPEDTCTRAQLITFLWRAAGCPEPTAKATGFTDVDLNAYYGKAVLWAVEKRITTGVDKTHFAPDDTVTRAQAVMLLYRLAGSPFTDYDAGFADVDAEALFADAVNWAAKNEIVNGIGGGLFDWKSPVTRGQAVTVLYRYFGSGK